MLWVGGSIVLHGMDVLGVHEPYGTIHHLAEAAGHALPAIEGIVVWAVTAACDGVLGTILGFVLIPVATKVIVPAYGAITGQRQAAH